MDLNRAQLIGNVTKDPEQRTTTTGQSVCTFGVATNQQWTDAQGTKQQRAEFHNIVAWGKLADICKQYLAKGRRVFAEGRLQTREWEGQDGQKRRTTEIVLDNMIMLDRANAGPGTTMPQPASSTPVNGSHPPAASTSADSLAPPPTSPSSASASALDQGIGEQEIRIEDIPF